MNIQERLTHHSVIIGLMLIAAAVIIATTMPGHVKKDYETFYKYQTGQPWTHDILLAEFELEKPIDEATRDQVVSDVRQSWIPIYQRDKSAMLRQLADIDTLREAQRLDKAVCQLITDSLRRFYNDGIVDNSTYEQITSGSLPMMRFFVDDGNELDRVSTREMHSCRWVYVRLDSMLHGESNILQRLNINDLRPNITLHERNDSIFADQVNLAIASRPGGNEILTGEEIVRTGQIVTPQIAMNIDAYVKKLDERDNKHNDNSHPRAGKIAVVVLLLIAFYTFMRFIRPRSFANRRTMLFLIMLIVLFSATVNLIVQLRTSWIFLVPFAIVPIVVSTFIDTRTAFFVHMIVTLICSMVTNDPGDFIIMQFIAGVISIITMKELSTRSQLVVCALLIFFAYVVGYSALCLADGLQLSEVTHDWHTVLRIGVNCVVLSFAYVAIFIIEKLFGFTSTMTLVEISDVNNPTLRTLANNCPGTFQHVLQVANIAQEAALKIGASAQLVRAGALYHDIGKIDNPAFFTENQSGVSPHNSLTPEHSAEIIINHVRDGQQRAERARLPKVIIDLIAQHHGKGKVHYFYNKACQAAGEGGEVDPEPFTYPGPNPQSKEAAIIMMADACEAAARSITNYSVEAINAMVESVVSRQVGDGLLREAPISFKDVETVKQVLAERLCAIYHTRISYPTAN